MPHEAINTSYPGLVDWHLITLFCTLAAPSTFAGNFILLGSIANFIVVEQAAAAADCRKQDWQTTFSVPLPRLLAV